MGAHENILLIRLKSIGDILFTLPAVHRVREAFPGARISFLTSREFAPLLEGFRDVDSVIALDRARLRGGNPVGIVQEVLSLLRRVRQPKFSLAIDFQGYGETALLTWWSGAPQRWGAVSRGGRSWAYSRSVQRDAGRHPAEDFLSLLDGRGLPSAALRNQFVLPDSAVAEGRRLFQAWGLEAARPTLLTRPAAGLSLSWGSGARVRPGKRAKVSQGERVNQALPPQVRPDFLPTNAYRAWVRPLTTLLR